MPRHNMMWNLTMLRIMNAIDVFTITCPLSNQLSFQLIKEYKWAWNNGPHRFIKFFKGVTP